MHREYGDDLHPYDHFICNDPYTSGAIHQGDVGIISPLFWRDELAGWAFSNAHVLDVGGMSPGGLGPRGLRLLRRGVAFPGRADRPGGQVRRVTSSGCWSTTSACPSCSTTSARSWRPTTRPSPGSKCCSTSTGWRPTRPTASRTRTSPRRSSAQRIAAVPDGVYEATDWVEYDGHGVDGLWKIHLRADRLGQRADSRLLGHRPAVHRLRQRRLRRRGRVWWGRWS